MILRQFLKGSIRSKIALNTGSQVLAKVFGAGATLLISIMVARTYGAQGYGDFTKITTFVAIFFLFSDFGLNAVALQQESVRSREQNTNHDVFPTLVSLRLLGSLFLMIVAVLVLAMLPRGTDQGYTPIVRIGILLFTPAIVFQAVLTTANAFYQKRLRYDLSTVAVGAGSLVALTVAILTVVTGKLGSLGGVFAILCGSIVTAGCAVLLVRRLGMSLSLDPSFTRMRRLLVRAIPVGVTLIFNVIYFRTDSFILTLTSATADVGIYGFAYKVFEVSLVLPTFFMNSIYPLFLAAVNRSDESQNNRISGEFYRLISRSLLFLVASSLVTVVVLWVAAPIVALIRHEFTGSIAPLRVLALSAPFFFLTNLTMWLLITLGKQKILALIYGVSMILNILLNMVFIPHYGYMAAAWITLVSESILLIVSGVTVIVLIRRKA
jgi:O-antigen/teichoic acid export membrane protein